MTTIDAHGGHHDRAGKYTEKGYSDADVTLGDGSSFARNAEWLEENGLELSAEGIQIMTDELGEWNVNAIHRVNAFKTAFERVHGYTYEQAEHARTAAAFLHLEGRREWAEAITAVLDAAGGDRAATPARHVAETSDGWENSNGNGSLESPAKAGDPRVQLGQVFDAVEDIDGGIIWHRRRDFIVPSDPTGIRFQASTQLTDDEAEHLRSLIAYQYARCQHRDEIGVDIRRDSPYSFTVEVNRETNIIANWGPIEKWLPEVVAEGTPVRTTDRMGNGTAGTRAIEAFPREISFEVYYDDVHAGVNLKDGEIFDEQKIKAMQGALDSLGYND